MSAPVATFQVAHKVESFFPPALEAIVAWVAENGGTAEVQPDGVDVLTADGVRRAGFREWVVGIDRGAFRVMTHEEFMALCEGQKVETTTTLPGEAA